MEWEGLQEPPAPLSAIEQLVVAGDAGLDPLVLAALVVAALLAGFIDSQVGGGGVITLPALLAAGLPPHLALGTNKLAATGASAMASFQYVRARLVPRLVIPLAALAFLGSLAGVATVLRLPATDVRILVLVVVVGMAAYVLARPRFGHQDHSVRRSTSRAVALAATVLAIGFYDGFLGPGTGSFLLFTLASLWGLPFVRAAAFGRVLNLSSNVAALLYFALAGQVAWLVGTTMLLGTITGGYLGARTTIRGGNRWVRWLFVAMAVALAGKLAWDLGS